MAEEYMFGRGLQCLFNFVMKISKLGAKEQREMKFEPVEMIGSPFEIMHKYPIRLNGRDSYGSEELYVGARKDEHGKTWHRFVLSSLETAVNLKWPLCVTDVCVDSYKIKEGEVHIEGHNWQGSDIPLDSDEGRKILGEWFEHGRKREKYSVAI